MYMQLLNNLFNLKTKTPVKETKKTVITNNENIEWKALVPFNSVLLPVMPFEAAMLPESVQAYVLSHALRVNNAPVDFAALALMTSVGALIAGSVEIQPKKQDTDWVLAPNIYSMIIGEPSTQKTPMLKCGLNLIDFVQEVLFDKINAVNSSFYKLQEQEYRSAKKKISDEAEALIQSGEVEQAHHILKKINELDEPDQIIRDLKINDATIESILIGLEKNPHGSLIFRDELSGWLTALGTRESERSLYLEAFDASKSPYTQKRVSRDDVKIKRLILSVMGGIQPSVVMPLITSSNHEGNENDGLLERILQFSVYPDKPNSYLVDQAPDYDEIKKVQNIFLNLAELTQQKDILCFKFSDDAQQIWSEWSAALIEKTKWVDVSLQSFYGKNHATCSKIALILHLIDEAANSVDKQEFIPQIVIDLKTVRKAIKWMLYLESHTKRILSLADSERDNLPAQCLLQNINKLGKKFTRQQLSQKNWRGLTSKDDRELAIAKLIESGYIIEVTKPTKAFIINPHCNS
jgi:hypothetical protein